MSPVPCLLALGLLYGRDGHTRGGHDGQGNCTFCNLIRGAAEVSLCHEDSDAIAFMDIQPVNNGHVLVVPREHYESLLDVPEDLGIHLFRSRCSSANAVRRVSGCEDLNIVVNSGKAAGPGRAALPRPHHPAARG